MGEGHGNQRWQHGESVMLAAAAHDTDRDKVMMAKYAIPEMVKNDGLQCRGSIVNLASVAGLRGGNPHLLYPTSKGAIVVSVDLDYNRTRPQYADPDLFQNMTRAMASHHAPDGIRVNCVCPGMV